MAHCQWGEAQGDVAQNHCFIVLCTGPGPVAAPGPQCVTVVPRVVLGVGVLGSHALYVSHVPQSWCAGRWPHALMVQLMQSYKLAPGTVPFGPWEEVSLYVGMYHFTPAGRLV